MRKLVSFVAALAMGLIFAAAPAPAPAGDAELGRKLFNRCKTCHRISGRSIGPRFDSVFGRTAGTIPRYRYSSGLVEAGQRGLVWNSRNMADYVNDPRGFVSGYLGKRSKSKHMPICKQTKRESISITPDGPVFHNDAGCARGFASTDMDHIAAYIAR